MTKIAFLIGSLRKESFTRKIARDMVPLFPDGYEIEWVDISQLPLYNQDFDDTHAPPQSYTDFREKMKKIDAVLFATPEYNRSVPGVLKNAIDVGSRPVKESIWNEKPALIVSVAPGSISGFGANHHLRQSLVFLNMPVVQQPEVYIGHVQNLLDETDGHIKESTKVFLQSAVDAFVHLIELYAHE